MCNEIRIFVRFQRYNVLTGRLQEITTYVQKITTFVNILIHHHYEYRSQFIESFGHSLTIFVKIKQI